MIWLWEVTTMDTKNIILKLRTERGMSQDELADKIMVTRQAVSRWENGDTVPNTDTLLYRRTGTFLSERNASKVRLLEKV